MSAHFDPGARVLLASPYGGLKRGKDGCLLVIGNGNPGTVVGASDSTSCVVTFDLIGGTVGVSVPEHWLTPFDFAQSRAPLPETTSP